MTSSCTDGGFICVHAWDKYKAEVTVEYSVECRHAYNDHMHADYVVKHLCNLPLGQRFWLDMVMCA